MSSQIRLAVRYWTTSTLPTIQIIGGNRASPLIILYHLPYLGVIDLAMNGANGRIDRINLFANPLKFSERENWRRSRSLRIFSNSWRGPKIIPPLRSVEDVNLGIVLKRYQDCTNYSQLSQECAQNARFEGHNQYFVGMQQLYSDLAVELKS